MSEWVSKSRFKAKAMKFFRQVEISGEPVVITDQGRPKLEVRLYRNEMHNPLDVLRGSVLRFDNVPVGDEQWEVLG
ncbi:hypothetical protein [Niveibacterium sp. SC-1]|uniref:hypothetical protein n=1 Tax=Niveibacterium sp. SC-1 TaxID=3135646 RepID=UPI00311F1C36